MVNYTFKLVLIALLLWLTVVAGRMGYANLQYFSAKNQVDSWVDNGAISSESSYRQALRAINLSNELHPDNPQYIETLATIQEWAVYGDFAEKSNFKLALANYHRSAELRPMWPWVWSSIVLTKWRLDEIDDEMWHALVMLGETGPYTKHANLTIVDVGLMMMEKSPEFAAQAETLAAEHYRRGMKNSQVVKSLKAIIKKREAEDIVAGW